MDAATAVAIVVPITSLVIGLVLVLRWGMSRGDSELAANRAQLEQAAQLAEADRQRDAAIVRATKAEGERDDRDKVIAQLHVAIDQLIDTNRDAIKEKVHAATGDDLVAAARAVFGVPQLPVVPAAGGTGGSAAAGGAAPAAAVRVPAVPGGG